MRSLRLLRGILPVFCVLLLLLPCRALADGEDYGPDISAETYCVIDGNSGEVLLSREKDKRMYPASTTKILTALLVIENVPDLDARLTFTESAVRIDPSSSTLEPKAAVGEVMSVRDALYGMLLKSANECGAMLGEYVAGSEAAFSEMMNRRAAEIGCRNTHFTNAYGIHDPEHYTTAYDLALILREAMKNPGYRKLNSTAQYTIPATNIYGARSFYVGHQMLRGVIREPGCIGGKTGSTPQAGKVLATAVDREGLYTVSTLMKATADTMYQDEQVLLEYTYGLRNGSIETADVEECGGTVQATANVRLRYSPSLYGAVSGFLEIGKEASRTGTIGEWSRLLIDGRTLYAASDFLEEEQEETTVPGEESGSEEGSESESEESSDPEDTDTSEDTEESVSTSSETESESPEEQSPESETSDTASSAQENKDPASPGSEEEQKPEPSSEEPDGSEHEEKLTPGQEESTEEDWVVRLVRRVKALKLQDVLIIAVPAVLVLALVIVLITVLRRNARRKHKQE